MQGWTALQRLELQEKEQKNKRKHIVKLFRCLWTLDIKSLRLQIKGKHSAGKEIQSSCAIYNIQDWLEKGHASYKNN